MRRDNKQKLSPIWLVERGKKTLPHKRDELIKNPAVMKRVVDDLVTDAISIAKSDGRLPSEMSFLTKLAFMTGRYGVERFSTIRNDNQVCVNTPEFKKLELLEGLANSILSEKKNHAKLS